MASGSIKNNNNKKHVVQEKKGLDSIDSVVIWVVNVSFMLRISVRKRDLPM